MAGHVVALYLREVGHEVTGSYRTDSKTTAYLKAHDIRMVELEATDDRSLSSLIDELNADVIVNCIGLLNTACDSRPDLAIYLNAYLPHRLASLAAEHHSRVIHISTDCVFAGNAGPYTETDIPDGASLYDKTKALGELNDGANLTLRQSIVGPDPDEKGIGLLNWFMQQKGSVGGWTNAIWTGLTTLELAKAVAFMSAEGASGLVNLVPAEDGISKYSLLTLFNKHIRRQPIQINKEAGLNSDKSLVRCNNQSAFMPLSYVDQIIELRDWTVAHAELYPHYSLKLL